MEQGQENSLSSMGIAETEVAQRIMFVKENLRILRKHYHDLALADRDNDDFLVELEMSYLFCDNDD